MRSFTRDIRLRPLKWGIQLGLVVALLYTTIFLFSYYDFLIIDPTKIAMLYPGFSTDPMGLALGFIWIVLEGFAVGYIVGMLSLLPKKR